MCHVSTTSSRSTPYQAGRDTSQHLPPQYRTCGSTCIGDSGPGAPSRRARPLAARTRDRAPMSFQTETAHHPASRSRAAAGCAAVTGCVRAGSR
eukprot:636850-Rhodomonas_salina.2